MNFTVNVDFFTDIITNSSSVVYSQASGVETMFAFLNDVIKEFGVDKTAEDIFDVVIVPDMDRLEDWIFSWYDEDGFQEKIENLPQENRLGVVKEKAVELASNPNFDMDEIYEYPEYEESSYLITTRDGKDTGLGEKVAKLFTHEAVYDG